MFDDLYRIYPQASAFDDLYRIDRSGRRERYVMCSFVGTESSQLLVVRPIVRMCLVSSRRTSNHVESSGGYRK